jgi:hypothetical protein
LSSPVSRPPNSELQAHFSTPDEQKTFSGRRSILFLVLILAALFVLFTGLFFSTVPFLFQPAPPVAKAGQIDENSSVVLSGKKATPPQIPADQSLLIEQEQGLSLVSAANGDTTALSTPGYIYNPSVRPVLLPSGQLLYSGKGIWLTDIAHSAPRQIASFPADQVLTSLVVNDDGSMMAWSTAPAQGKGTVKIYAGPLEHTALVYQQSASRCPCFRAFSFLHSTPTQAQPALLLSDDRGDHDPVYYGMWLLDLNQGSSAQPRPLLSDQLAQGPLALSPTSNTLLYAHAEGFVPAPTDDSVPPELAAQTYANSLSLIPIQPSSASIGPEQEIVPKQSIHSNSAEYHWITTPRFSPDGRTLIYVLFSSDSTQPYDRHNALYMVRFPNSSDQHASSPQLLASSPSAFIELGPWLNSHLLTFYSDGGIYILDTQNNGVAEVDAATGGYAHIIAAVTQ